ncbi:DUF4190 domain-containing protein [Sanguibacter sp. A247]|uniref:DUF4190 domain-containing protein n=1 Tax=unclassified Sanguibacter TaxID=2645534 RepID=UPI003FD6E0C8
MTRERRGAVGRERDGARTAVASVVTGIVMAGPVAFVLGVVSLAARPVGAVRRLAMTGCALGLLGTAAWGLWAANLETDSAIATPAAQPTQVQLALPDEPAGAASGGAEATAEARTHEAPEVAITAEAATTASLTVDDLDVEGTTDVPVLGAGASLAYTLPLKVGRFSTESWQPHAGGSGTEAVSATFTRDGVAVVVVVRLHATATEAESTLADVVRERLSHEDAKEGKELESDAGARVRRVVRDGKTTFVWSEFTTSIEIDGPSKAARSFMDRFVLGAGERSR